MRSLHWLALLLALGSVSLLDTWARVSPYIARNVPCPCAKAGCCIPCTACCGSRGMADCLGLPQDPTVLLLR